MVIGGLGAIGLFVSSDTGLPGAYATSLSAQALSPFAPSLQTTAFTRSLAPSPYASMFAPVASALTPSAPSAPAPASAPVAPAPIVVRTQATVRPRAAGSTSPTTIAIAGLGALVLGYFAYRKFSR